MCGSGYGLAPGQREQLLRAAREVAYPHGTRLFEEGRRTDRFWILRTGTVSLDTHLPGRRAAVVTTLGSGELPGWSWLFIPQVWHLGAEATTPVTAYAFETAENCRCAARTRTWAWA